MRVKKVQEREGVEGYSSSSVYTCSTREMKSDSYRIGMIGANHDRGLKCTYFQGKGLF